MTFSFPPHQENRFKEILDVIPTSQKRIDIDKWHWLLGELCSMAIPLNSARGLLSHIKEVLLHMAVKRVTLTRGVYQALADFV